jgi:hypothetical protein
MFQANNWPAKAIQIPYINAAYSQSLCAFFLVIYNDIHLWKHTYKENRQNAYSLTHVFCTKHSSNSLLYTK